MKYLVASPKRSGLNPNKSWILTIRMFLNVIDLILIIASNLSDFNLFLIEVSGFRLREPAFVETTHLFYCSIGPFHR